MSHIEMVSINSIRSNSEQLVILEKFNMSSSHNSTTISYNIDAGSDENIIPIHIFRILFPKATKEQLAPTKK